LTAGASSSGRLQYIAPGESIGALREEPVVVIPVFGARDYFERCLKSVLRHTPSDVPILIADDASPGPEIEELVRELERKGVLPPRFFYLRQRENVGFVLNMNTAFAAAAPGDVVILNSDCEVGPEWLERLRDAAYADTNVATASALTNHGTILSLPERNTPQPALPDHTTLDEVATNLARSSQRLRPRITTAIGHCTYIRRSALELVGDFDEAFSPGYGEEVDFSQRCMLRGLSHVAADDVFVLHSGGESFGSNEIKHAHEELIESRYPYYHFCTRTQEERQTGPLVRALDIGARAINGLTVTIDARRLSPTVTGTQVHVLELIHALWRTHQIRLRVAVSSGIGKELMDDLTSLEGLEVVFAEAIGEEFPKTEIVHRPYQVFDADDLKFLKRAGDRIVITQQDLISYRNPGYGRWALEWDDLQRLTRVSLATADAILFFSQHAADDALAEELVDPARTHVVHLGVDHHAFAPPKTLTRPESLPAEVADGGFLLCLGTNFKHKNRVFALEVFRALQERHNWDGWLVFAGPHAASGTSEEDERVFLDVHPRIAERTVDLESVSSEEKQWLCERSTGLIYPSVYEGFGLIPFEAADAGRPCFFAWQTALTETLPEKAATLVPWNAEQSADAIAEVIADERKADALTKKIQSAGERLRWDKTATEILAVYEKMLKTPHRSLSTAIDGSVPVWALATAQGGAAVDMRAMPYKDYHALTAIMARAWLRRPVFFLIRIVYRLGYLVRHSRF
jgi:GT2 family glycosyltransferase/glycosyltransferase involved in cell wall biosynthesis